MSDEVVPTMGEALQEFFRGRSITFDRQRGWIWHTTFEYADQPWVEEMVEDEEGTLLYLLDHYINGDWPGGDE